MTPESSYGCAECLSNASYLGNFTNVTYAEIDCSDQFASTETFGSLYFQALISILYTTIFFVALLGNGAVCFIVSAFPRMRTVTNYFIANMALGDILMSVFCVPFSFVSQLVLNHWPFGAWLCRLVNYSQAVSVLVSAYTLVALAADRCRAITSPLRPRLSKPRAQAAIAAVWAGALATAAPIPIVSALARPTPWHEACQRSICREEWPLAEQSYYYSMALMALQFVVPLAVLVFTYTRIAVAVWGERPPGEAENSRDKRMAKSKRKMIKMMVTVVIVFTVCWLPFNILIVLWSINTDNRSWDTWEPLPYVWFAFHWLAMSHSCYNPIIYCYMNARFRYGFIQVAAKLPCLRGCLGRAVYRAERVDMQNGVNMTETSLHRVNTCTTFISVRRRAAVRCSCSPSLRGDTPSCSPSRSTSSTNRPTCSPARSTYTSSLSPAKANTLHPQEQCLLRNRASICGSESCVNRRNSKNNLTPGGYNTMEPYLHARNSCHSGSISPGSSRSGCIAAYAGRNGSLNRYEGRSSPVRAASLLTTEGTVCANNRRNVGYMEDQI